MRKKNRKILIGFFMIITVMILFQGCKREKTNKDIPVVTINNDKVYLDETMYYIWKTEKECASLEEHYERTYDLSFWDQDVEDGMTVRDSVKQDVMDEVIRTHILYSKAVAEDYSLSKEEKEICVSKAEEIYHGLTEEQLKIMGLTKPVLEKIMEKEAIVDLYFKGIVKTLNVDREGAKASINAAEYKQYDVETIGISKEKKLEDGKSEPLTKKEQDLARKTLTHALKSAKKKTELSQLVEDDKSELEYEAFSFLEADETVEEVVKEAAKNLLEGEVSDILETQDRYIFIKLKSNKSDESYRLEQESAIENAEYKAFDEFYDTLEKQAAITVNQEVWGTIIMGKTTILDK